MTNFREMPTMGYFRCCFFFFFFEVGVTVVVLGIKQQYHTVPLVRRDRWWTGFLFYRVTSGLFPLDRFSVQLTIRKEIEAENFMKPTVFLEQLDQHWTNTSLGKRHSPAGNRMWLPAMAGDTVCSHAIVLSISEHRNERTTGNGWTVRPSGDRKSQ